MRAIESMPEAEDKEVGQRLRLLREDAKLTQVGLAEKSGVDANTIARLERGEHTPSQSSLRKLATALKVTVSDILGY